MALRDVDSLGTIECGKDAAKHFMFDGAYRNMNHGSYGTYPREIRTALRHYQDLHEARPDWFIRYEGRKVLDESREAIAKLINAPVDTCVFVQNATTGINTVLRNLVFAPGDVIIYFATVYGACHKTLEYIEETTPLQTAKVEYSYPIEDQELLDRFEQTIAAVKAQGKNVRGAIFDTLVALPGVRMPFERLTQLCRKHDILSIVDAAHGVGHISLDVGALDPDFLVSNCHKWLFTPRGCAVFYVPQRNQHLMRTSLPTSHGFVPRSDSSIANPMPPTAKSEFVHQFEYCSTIDNSPYLCVAAGLKWRAKVTWKNLNGEEAIIAYSQYFASRGGQIVADILGTEVLKNESGTLSKCNFANVRLPVEVATEDRMPVAQWLSHTLAFEYNTFMALTVHGGKLWVRLSSNIYLTEDDFEWAGRTLEEVCKRADQGEWKKASLL